MKRKQWNMLCENGNTIVEYIIVLPLILIILFSFINLGFVMHDRATLDGAAKRGTIYAARCISDPNYESILAKSGNNPGSLDISANVSGFTYANIGKNIQPYRYITGSSQRGLEEKTSSEIKSILEATRIPWRDIDIISIDVRTTNKLYYQEVTVTLSVEYPLPGIVKMVGLDEAIDYTVTSTTMVNDPDEFIRNADLVVDVIAQVDSKTGGHISKAKEKIELLGDKLSKWLEWLNI